MAQVDLAVIEEVVDGEIVPPVMSRWKRYTDVHGTLHFKLALTEREMESFDKDRLDLITSGINSIESAFVGT